MTIVEAGQRIGLSRNGMQRYLLALGIKTKWRVTAKNGYRYYDLTEDDVKAIAAERRRRVFAHSETKSRNMQRVSLKYRKEKIANRDPVERRRSLDKGRIAAADKRRRLREWYARHDDQSYDYDLRRVVTKKTGGVHPWRAAEEASMARWKARNEKP